MVARAGAVDSVGSMLRRVRQQLGLALADMSVSSARRQSSAWPLCAATTACRWSRCWPDTRRRPVTGPTSHGQCGGMSLCPPRRPLVGTACPGCVTGTWTSSRWSWTRVHLGCDDWPPRTLRPRRRAACSLVPRPKPQADLRECRAETTLMSSKIVLIAYPCATALLRRTVCSRLLSPAGSPGQLERTLVHGASKITTGEARVGRQHGGVPSVPATWPAGVVDRRRRPS